MTHPRAQKFIDYDDIDTTTVDVQDGEIGDWRRVVINFAGGSWVLSFCHEVDHNFAEVRLFDDNSPLDHSTPIGVTGSTNEPTTNHGFPAHVVVTLLADHDRPQ